MITAELLSAIYAKSTAVTRVTFEEGLRDEKGERLNVLYEIISVLSYNGSAFSADFVRSDGGIKEFCVTYQMGDYTIIVSRFVLFGDNPDFDTIQAFADWLNTEEQKVIASATLLSLNKGIKK